MTSQYLQIDSNTVVICNEDADAFISATALNLVSSTKKKVVVIAGHYQWTLFSINIDFRKDGVWNHCLQYLLM